MNVNREEFLNKLEMVKPGLSPREFVEQSSCYCFKDGKVYTFNDEVSCQMDTGVDITGAVQAASLLDILSKLDDEELTISENDSGELEFSGKRKSFGITKEAEIFLPIDKVETPEKWRSLPKEFTEAVGLVQHCVSGDESMFKLTCIHIAPTHVESCDNFQLMRVKLDMGLKEAVLVRGKALSALTSLAMEKISITKSWVHFKNSNGLIYSCRRYVEDYPNLDQLLTMKNHHPIVIPKGMAKASERAGVFAVDETGQSHVMVSLVPGKMRIKGEGTSGWYKEVSKVSYDGPPLEFLISPVLLKQISENHSDAEISDRKLTVRGGHWQYCTVLSAPAEKKEKPAEGLGKKKKTEEEE